MMLWDWTFIFLINPSRANIQRCLPGPFGSLHTFQIKISNIKLDTSHEKIMHVNEFTFSKVRSLSNTAFVAKVLVRYLWKLKHVPDKISNSKPDRSHRWRLQLYTPVYFNLLLTASQNLNLAWKLWNSHPSIRRKIAWNSLQSI